MKQKYSLLIHGGAGMISDKKDDYTSSLLNIIKIGQKLLAEGNSALDVVEKCVQLLEDDPLYNAGKGSVLNEKGQVEMDASIMDGRDLSAGAVAGVWQIKNPVSLARLVKEKSKHVFLIAQGAMDFAKINNVKLEDESYFITPARQEQLAKAKTADQVVLDHSTEKKLGTVGAVAMDIQGNLAAATSTGGLVNKKFGRVGDSPLVGSGVYADNESCAVSCTGIGEHFIRTNLAKVISDFVLMKKLNAQKASDKAIDYLVKRIDGQGGVIVVDKNGKIGIAHSTPNIICGGVTEKMEPFVRFE